MSLVRIIPSHIRCFPDILGVETEDLRGKARHAEAGRVLLEYGRDVKGAVSVLSEGGLFSEALRLVSTCKTHPGSTFADSLLQTSLYAMPKLVLDIILPSVHDCREKLSEEAAEIKDQVVKQVTRLHELREKRLSDTGMCLCLQSTHVGI